MKVELYVEEHIFKHTPKSKEKLPECFYSDVTYNDDLKSLVVTLGNYYSLGYSKVNEILNDFSDGIINISEGTIDNIYEEFANKSLDTINNITNNLLNGSYQHTDETTTSENGKESYYHGLAGGIPFWKSEEVLIESLKSLKLILELGGIHCRSTLISMGVDI